MPLRFRRAAFFMALFVALGALAPACRREPYTPEAAYSRFCADCHAVDGRGDARTIGPNPHLDLTVSEMLARRDEAEVARRIAEGKDRMPGFSTKLTNAEIAALAAFTIERYGPPAAAPAPAEGR